MNTCHFCLDFGKTTALCMEGKTCGIQDCCLTFKHEHYICNACITKSINNLNTKNYNDHKNSKKNISKSKKIN